MPSETQIFNCSCLQQHLYSRINHSEPNLAPYDSKYSKNNKDASKLCCNSGPLRSGGTKPFPLWGKWLLLPFSYGDMRTDRMSLRGSQEVDGMKRLLKPKPELHTHTQWNTQMQTHIRKSDTLGRVCLKKKKGLDWHTIAQLSHDAKECLQWISPVKVKINEEKNNNLPSIYAWKTYHMKKHLMEWWPKTTTNKYKSHNLDILNIVPPST